MTLSLPATSPNTLPKEVDLAVIGGGPSGTTVAALVARAGHSTVSLIDLRATLRARRQRRLNARTVLDRGL
ncbi:MAG: NAD(P)-binding protein [Wenzhouxiangella sp.]